MRWRWPRRSADRVVATLRRDGTIWSPVTRSRLPKRMDLAVDVACRTGGCPDPESGRVEGATLCGREGYVAHVVRCDGCGQAMLP